MREEREMRWRESGEWNGGQRWRRRLARFGEGGRVQMEGCVLGGGGRYCTIDTVTD